MRRERRQHSKRLRSTQSIRSFSFAPISNGGRGIPRVCFDTREVTTTPLREQTVGKEIFVRVFRVGNHSWKSRFDSIATPKTKPADDNEEKPATR